MIPPDMSVINVCELTKSYDKNLVVDDVSFSVDQGRLVALDTPQGLIDSAGLEQTVRFTTTALVDDEWRCSSGTFRQLERISTSSLESRVMLFYAITRRSGTH